MSQTRFTMDDFSFSNTTSRPSTTSSLGKSFSEHAGHGGYRPQHQHDDSQSTLQGGDSHFNFSRKIPQNDIDTSYHSPEIVVDEKAIARLSMQPPINGHLGANTSGLKSPSSIWLPLLIVLIPNIACPAVLLALVFWNKFQPQTDIFAQYREFSQQFPGYILVTLSATRLAIVSSVAATLAPFLTSFIMGVWKFHVVGNIRRRSRTLWGNASPISDVPQLSLLISLLAASMDGLLTYLRKCLPSLFWRGPGQRRPVMARQVHSSASIFLLSMFLVLSMFIADTVFHTYTDAVNIQEVRASPAISALGHRVIDKCENFDRSQSLCLPCTWDVYGSTTDFQQLTNNVYEVRNNISKTSEIHSLGSGLSILVPNSARVPNVTEYSARTIGISTQCQPITKSCNPIATNGSNTQFNCSDAFRGVINKAPVKPADQYFTIADPDTPPLNLKLTAYLQLGIFEDAELSTPYNPVNYNTSESGWVLEFGNSSTTPCPSDASLLNKIHVGVAGRFDLFSTRVDVNLLNDSGLFSTGGDAAYYMDFMFGCSVEAVEVEYVWAENGVRAHTTSPVNGSLLNMYVGQMQYYTNSPSNDWTNDVLQMALQANSGDMANTWGRLFGTRVLSVIGGYSASSVNLAEQTRRSVLVAKVPIGALCFLVACSAVYSVLVLVLAVNGCCIARRDPNVYGVAKELNFTTQLGRSLSEIGGGGGGADALSSRGNNVYGHERNERGSRESLHPNLSLSSRDERARLRGLDEGGLLRHASERNNCSMPAWI